MHTFIVSNLCKQFTNGFHQVDNNVRIKCRDTHVDVQMKVPPRSATHEIKDRFVYYGFLQEDFLHQKEKV